MEDNSGLCVVGINAENGAPVWRTRLTAGIPSVPPRGAPVNITVDGASVYLCTGNGFAYALDGYNGSVRWATLYQRPGEVPARARPTREQNREIFWAESLVLVEGDTIVVAPEDSAVILGLDRRCGTRLWTAPKPEGVDYVVGRRGAALIAAGRRAVVSVNLADGRERWRTPIDGSTGWGTMWGQEVLIPCNRTILRWNAGDGTALEPARTHTLDGLPLGNLYANGDRLLVVGLERIYALVDARPVFARLEDRLKQQPAAATYAERGALYAGLGQYPEAVTDLREAWIRQRGTPAESAARGALLNALWQVAQQAPATTETFCAEARRMAATPAEQAESIWRWGQCRERAGDTNGAIAMYATAFAAPDVPLAPQGHEKDRNVLSHRLAARRLSTLLTDPVTGAPRAASGKGEGVALLEQPAAQALDALGAKAGVADLTELATFFAGTRAGTAAAIKAAKLAIAHGDLGTAEAILQRIMALTASANRIELARALAQLYERMKWPKGTARLRNDWPRLGGGTPLPDFLAQAPIHTAGAPPPPWRLRWRARIPARSSMFPVSSGMYYHATNQTGCLDLETGQPRWQVNRMFGSMRGYDTDWSDRHLLLVFTGDAGGCVDVWSGTLMTHQLFQGTYEWICDSGGHDRYPMSLSRFGLATVRYGHSDSLLAGVDVLTGRVGWKRGDVDTLHGWWTPAFVEPDTRIFLMSHAWDTGGRIAKETDLWTGEVKPPRIFDPVEYAAWTRRLSARENREDPFAGERGVPVLNDRRLTVKNLRTGVTLWSSPPEIAVSSYAVLPGGFVAAYRDANEWALLDGEDGQMLGRATGSPALLGRATRIGDALVATDEAQLGTNDVVVLDTVGKRIVFQGRTPRSMSIAGPVASMLNHLLVTVTTNKRSSLTVVNEQGQVAVPWSLPRPEDIRTEPSPNYTTRIVDGLILMTDDKQGTVLAYEHDPDGDGKSPAAGAAP
jgi:tetratricopeptide (TPR) repeat protein